MQLSFLLHERGVSGACPVTNAAMQLQCDSWQYTSTGVHLCSLTQQLDFKYSHQASGNCLSISTAAEHSCQLSICLELVCSHNHVLAEQLDSGTKRRNISPLSSAISKAPECIEQEGPCNNGNRMQSSACSRMCLICSSF